MSAPTFCRLCNRHVEAKRQIGVGTLLACLATMGFWIFAIPFYRLRCSICKSTLVGIRAEDLPPGNWWTRKSAAGKVLMILLAIFLGITAINILRVIAMPSTPQAGIASVPATPVPGTLYAPKDSLSEPAKRQWAASELEKGWRVKPGYVLTVRAEGADMRTIRIGGRDMERASIGMYIQDDGGKHFRQSLLDLGFRHLVWELPDGREVRKNLTTGLNEPGNGRIRRRGRR